MSIFLCRCKIWPIAKFDLFISKVVARIFCLPYTVCSLYVTFFRYSQTIHIAHNLHKSVKNWYERLTQTWIQLVATMTNKNNKWTTELKKNTNRSIHKWMNNVQLTKYVWNGLKIQRFALAFISYCNRFYVDKHLKQKWANPTKSNKFNRFHAMSHCNWCFWRTTKEKAIALELNFEFKPV